MIQNRQVELSVIGAALNDPEVAKKVAGLDADCFSYTDLKTIFLAIQKMVNRNDIPDIVTVSNMVDEELNGMSSQTLIEAIQVGFMPSMYRQYETMLVDYKRRRSLEMMCRNVINRLPDFSEDTDSIMSSCKSVIDGNSVRSDGTSMKDALGKMMENIATAQQSRCATGISGIDRLCNGGFSKGQLVILAARPAVGKTALALSIACNVARKRDPVMFVSLEMSEDEVASRLVAADAQVELDSLISGRLDEYASHEVGESVERLSSVPLEIVTNANTPLQIRRKAVSMKQGKGLSMIVIDYIQLLRSDEKHEGRYAEVSAISRELKLMAMQLEIPIIALTQLNRASEEGGKSRMPTMAEAKDSGSIEQDANVFMILHTPDEPKGRESEKELPYWNGCRNRGTTWQKLWLCKNRQGKTGMINIEFDKPRMTFKTLVNYGETRW